MLNINKVMYKITFVLYNKFSLEESSTFNQLHYSILILSSLFRIKMFRNNRVKDDLPLKHSNIHQNSHDQITLLHDHVT